MKKGKGIIKKVLATVAVTAVTVSLASNAAEVAGLTEFLQGAYTNVNLTYSKSFEDPLYLHGYYETKKDDHEARTRTRFFAGDFKTDVYSDIRYLKGNKTALYSGDDEDRGRVTGNNGWIESKWVSLPTGTYSSVLAIKFYARVRDKSGKACYADTITVNW